MSDEFYPVGKISRLFGNEGELAVNLYDNFPDEITDQEPVYVMIDTLPVPLFIDHFRKKGKAGAVVRFSDIDTPARAEQLLGLHIIMKASDGDPEGNESEDLYPEDLAGFRAEICGLEEDCVIAGFIENEMNPLFRVSCGEREFLVPAVDDFIREIDTEGRCVVFDLPDGLTDLE